MKHFFGPLKVPASDALTVKTKLTQTEAISKIESFTKGSLERVLPYLTPQPHFKGKVRSDGFEVYIRQGVIGRKRVVDGFMPQIKAILNETDTTNINMTIGFFKKDRVFAGVMTGGVRLMMFALLVIPLLGIFYEHQSLIQAGPNPQSSVTWASYRGYLDDIFEGSYLKVLTYFFGAILAMQLLFLTLPSLLMKRGMKQSRELMLTFFDS